MRSSEAVDPGDRGESWRGYLRDCCGPGRCGRHARKAQARLVRLHGSHIGRREGRGDGYPYDGPEAAVSCLATYRCPCSTPPTCLIGGARNATCSPICRAWHASILPPPPRLLVLRGCSLVLDAIMMTRRRAPLMSTSRLCSLWRRTLYSW
jgi:hypothetical protein